MDAIVVLTTCPNRDEARKMACGLTEGKLAACVQLNEIESFYSWQGVIENASEVRLTLKARAKDYPAIESFIRSHSSYETPQIIALPVVAGLKQYLDWLADETAR